MNELDDRRQSAREAFYDAVPAFGEDCHATDPLTVAIEAATRVRITPEIIAAGTDNESGEREIERLIAAFRAAGFEVQA